MRRRRFLGVVGLGAGLAASSALPTWLRRAFADSSVTGPRLAPSLAEGQRRARASGKPLLVLIVPTDAVERHDRGMAFGELLNHGTSEQIAPLSLVEVACATLADVDAVVPVIQPTSGPLMVLLEEHQPPLLLGAAEALTRYDWQKMGQRNLSEGADEVRIANERIAQLAHLLERLGDRALVKRSVQRWSERFGVVNVDEEIAKSVEAVDHAAPMIWDAMPASARGRRFHIDRLAEAVIARLRVLPPTGSRWGNSSGCGTRFEPTPDELRQRREEDERARAAGLPPPVRNEWGVKCGMGHVPARSARFLDFLAKG